MRDGNKKIVGREKNLHVPPGAVGPPRPAWTFRPPTPGVFRNGSTEKARHSEMTRARPIAESLSTSARAAPSAGDQDMLQINPTLASA
jgi:hypothetical protein